jgi:hypothetical protein
MGLSLVFVRLTTLVPKRGIWHLGKAMERVRVAWRLLRVKYDTGDWQ